MASGRSRISTMPRQSAASLLALLCMAGFARAAEPLDWASVFGQPAQGYLAYTATYQSAPGVRHSVAVERLGDGRVRRVTDGRLEVDYRPDLLTGGRYRVVDYGRQRVYQGSAQSLHRIGMLASAAALDGRPVEPPGYLLTHAERAPVQVAGWQCDWYRVVRRVPARASAAVDEVCWSQPLSLALSILRTETGKPTKVLWSVQQVSKDPAAALVAQRPTAGYSTLDLDDDVGPAAD